MIPYLKNLTRPPAVTRIFLLYCSLKLRYVAPNATDSSPIQYITLLLREILTPWFLDWFIPENLLQINLCTVAEGTSDWLCKHCTHDEPALPGVMCLRNTLVIMFQTSMY